jgi:hypothetical protein
MKIMEFSKISTGFSAMFTTTSCAPLVSLVLLLFIWTLITLLALALGFISSKKFFKILASLLEGFFYGFVLTFIVLWFYPNTPGIVCSFYNGAIISIIFNKDFVN